MIRGLLARCPIQRSGRRSRRRKSSHHPRRSTSVANKNTPPRLGRGLAALLGDVSVPSGGDRGPSVGAIPMDRIDPNPFQPRSDFDPAELESLAESIRVQGVLQPILVRPNPTIPERFQIVAGERRFRAAMQASLNEI